MHELDFVKFPKEKNRLNKIKSFQMPIKNFPLIVKYILCNYAKHDFFTLLFLLRSFHFIEYESPYSKKIKKDFTFSQAFSNFQRLTDKRVNLTKECKNAMNLKSLVDVCALDIVND